LVEFINLLNSIWFKLVYRDRLPTKDNLAMRGIISQDMQLCANGCGELELVSRSLNGETFVAAAHLACLCMSFVEWKK